MGQSFDYLNAIGAFLTNRKKLLNHDEHNQVYTVRIVIEN